MKTKLRLLLDECLQGELAEEIKQLNQLKAEWVCDIPALRSLSDEDLMRYAQKQKSILVTVERRINESRFPICTHRGIIVFQGKNRHESVKAETFKKFMLCGKRRLCNHGVTYLRSDEVVFRHKDADGRLYDQHFKF